MITDAILLILLAFIFLVTLPLRVLPDATLSPEVSTSLTTLSPYLGNIASVSTLLVGTILGIIVLIVVFESLVLVYKGINWVIRKIPGLN